MPKTYTKEGIIAQTLIAFGQGMGAVRISHDAALKVKEHYEALLKKQPKTILDDWRTDAVQALERVRASGRKAVQATSLAAGTATSVKEVEDAIGAVETASATGMCRDDPGTS